MKYIKEFKMKWRLWGKKKNLSTLQMKNNNEMTVNVVPGILSFQICGRESQQRLPKELKLKKVSLAFGLEITEN